MSIRTDLRAAPSIHTTRPTITLPRFRPLAWILGAMEAYARFERHQKDMRKLREMEPHLRRDIG
ncbi:MAG: hypothetical protein AAGG47_02490, partial [Pseudomonadota bacterium]